MGVTHKRGHTLDLVITRQGEYTVRNVHIVNRDISDHYSIDFNIFSCHHLSRNMDGEIFRRKNNNNNNNNNNNCTHDSHAVQNYCPPLTICAKSIVPLRILSAPSPYPLIMNAPLRLRIIHNHSLYIFNIRKTLSEHIIV